MAGSRCLALINKGSFRRLQRCLANLWFSLSPQHRKLILSVLLAGLFAEMHQRMGLWQRVKRLSGGRQRVVWPSSGSTRRSGNENHAMIQISHHSCQTDIPFEVGHLSVLLLSL